MSYRSKVSPEDKAKAVEAILRGETSLKEVRRKYGVVVSRIQNLSGSGSQLEICKKYKIRSSHQLRDWIKVYNSGRDFKEQSGGICMMLNGTLSNASCVKLKCAVFFYHRRHPMSMARATPA